ncbi:hypothetical protein [Geoglobus acetivorans]|uniref:Uncharacterized protein n=1 Tax=Geoglobus acetivorans TaxID=565033 RepID=A0A0A7GGJ4_GEOAI|nr:hypothetical protein GACE_1923 [Geoglobus acetivorans]
MKRAFAVLLVLVIVGSIISPVMAAEMTSAGDLDSLISKYNGTGKEYIKKVGPGKYVVKIDENSKIRNKILKDISEYLKNKATKDLENLKKKGIQVPSPGERNSKTSGSIVSPNSIRGTCILDTSRDIVTCAGWDDQWEYWNGGYVEGQTYFVAKCDPIYTSCDLKGWSSGTWYGSGNADEIKLITEVTISGFFVTISWPPSFTQYSNTGTFEDTFNDVSSAMHSYANLHAEDWLGITGMRQRDDANVRIGNNAIHVISEVYF